jgi:hypothetical protein
MAQSARRAPSVDALPAWEWMVLERGDGSVEPIAKLGEFKAEQVHAKV